MPTSYGVFTYSNGEVYEGYFYNSIREGRGRYLHADGSIYQGEWQDD